MYIVYNCVYYCDTCYIVTYDVRDVVGDGGHVRADAARGVGERGSVLDLHADQGVRVIRAPDLRAVVEHAGVEAAAA
jgi:hypothetical protein